MNKINKSLLEALLILATVFAIFGCSKDCAVCPKPDDNQPYSGRIYVSVQIPQPGAIVYIFNAQTDSIVDSITNSSEGATVAVSKDGRLLLVGTPGTTWVYDAKSLHLLTTISAGARFGFMRNDNSFYIIRGNVISIYRVSDFSLITSRDLGFTYEDIRYIQSLDRLFISKSPDSLFKYEVDSLTVQRRWRVSRTPTERAVLWHFDINPLGDIIHIIDESPGGIYYLTYSLKYDSLLSMFPLYYRGGHPKVDPLGNEVYVTDPGFPGDLYNPGTIYVFDAKTGDYHGGISLVGFLRDSPAEPLDAWSMTFSPDGNDLFVTTGHILTRTGTVLRYNPKTKELRGLLFPGIDRYPSDVAVGPKP